MDEKREVLSVGVSIVYTLQMEKDVGFRIRIDRSLRQRFLDVCRAQDKPAAQVLREFMRDYVEHNSSDKPKPTPKELP